MDTRLHIHAVVGPTASGKSAKGVALAKELDGEVISVDSRQVYRMLDIGTEKTTGEEMQGIPHHLIDICDPRDSYSAGGFVVDATKLIHDITARGKVPILVGGTHFYFDALIYGIPEIASSTSLRKELESRSTEDLYKEIQDRDSRRAAELDPQNRRRLVRALEIIHTVGVVPERAPRTSLFNVSWTVINPPKEELLPRLSKRLDDAFTRGLIEEVARVREYVGDARLNELGLEYRIVGEYLRGEREKDELAQVLTHKLWQYARAQKKWLRKLTPEQA